MAQALVQSAPPVTYPARRRFSPEEFRRLCREGFFGEERVELIQGEIWRMAPTGPSHAVSKTTTLMAFPTLRGDSWHIRVDEPLSLGDSEPVPDIAVVPGKPEDYREAHPSSALLVIEIADTSLEYDRTVKAGVYANAGIPEYWIVNLVERVVEVYREPTQTGYRSVHLTTAEESLSPSFTSEFSIPAWALLEGSPKPRG